MSRVNVLCMKWGKRYTPDYVNVLRNALQHRLKTPHRFVCLTDETEGINPDIETLPIPPIAPHWHKVFHNSAIPPHKRRLTLRRLVHGVWPKLALFQPQIHDLSGTALFLDLDVAILRDLDPLLENPDKNALRLIRENPKEPHGNSSAILFNIGAQAQIYQTFMKNPADAFLNFRNEQRFASAHAHSISFWPDAWFSTFRRDCMQPFPLNFALPLRPPPAEARLLLFHGEPNPHDILKGGWWGRGARQSRSRAPWLENYWRRYS